MTDFILFCVVADFPLMIHHSETTRESTSRYQRRSQTQTSNICSLETRFFFFSPYTFGGFIDGNDDCTIQLATMDVLNIP